VWTGSKLIVWGGSDPGFTTTGGLYDPTTDAWTATSTSAAARSQHTAVWTGSKMIVWGGLGHGGSYLSTGGIYDPTTDSWSAMSTAGAPTGRIYHTAVWTGSRMIVWGGYGVGGPDFNTGGLYDPATDTWTATSTSGAPTPRSLHTAVWTGSKMIVWGGYGPGTAWTNTGHIYDPATDSWTVMSTTGAPTGRTQHVAVWTGSRMVVWGGFDLTFTTTGGVYDPATDSWTATSTSGAPTGRVAHRAVWTGSKMIVWGGSSSLSGAPCFDSGGIYNPATDEWTATPGSGAPLARTAHTAVWTGSVMIVWGGRVVGTENQITDTGGRYADPSVIPGYHTVIPCRVFDTRERRGRTLGAPIACGTEHSFAVTGECGVPSGATAVSVNLTETGATAQGHLRLFAAGVSAPITSTLNYVAGQTRANNAVTSLGGSGHVSILCLPSGTTHVILDVNGYFQ
jgi:hypothetical protein